MNNEVVYRWSNHSNESAASGLVYWFTGSQVLKSLLSLCQRPNTTKLCSSTSSKKHTVTYKHGQTWVNGVLRPCSHSAALPFIR